MQTMHRAKLRCYFTSQLFVIVSCRSKPAPAISFYYWKTNFELNQYENKILAQNNVQSLYVRYFDVDLDPGGLPKPVSTVTFNSSVPRKSIIPVVYIKNRVFEKTDSNGIFALGKNILQLIAGIN